MLPILQRELVEKRAGPRRRSLRLLRHRPVYPWYHRRQHRHLCGAQPEGAAGGVVATLGLVFPCLVIIMLIAAFLQNFAEQPVVVHAFNGVRACVCALILSSVPSCARARWWTGDGGRLRGGAGAGGARQLCVLPGRVGGSVLSFCSPWCWWWPQAWPDCASGRRRRAAAVIYLQLFFEFFKAGLFAIGGGLATIPFLTDIGQRTGWFTSGELANMIAISESTPAPWGEHGHLRGLPHRRHRGGVIATLGLVCPPSSSS